MLLRTLLLGVFAEISTADDWTAGQLVSFCHFDNVSVICNPDKVIDEWEEGKLSSMILKAHDRVNPCSHRLLVALADSVRVDNVSGSVPAVASSLRQRLTPSDCCKTTVILVSRRHREIATSACDNSDLELCEIQEIFSRHRGQFASGNYFEGLKSLIKEYLHEFRDPKKSCSGLTFTRVVCFALGALFVGALIEVCVLSATFYLRKRRTQNSASYRAFHDAHEEQIELRLEEETAERKQLRHSNSFWM